MSENKPTTAAPEQPAKNPHSTAKYTGNLLALMGTSKPKQGAANRNRNGGPRPPQAPEKKPVESSVAKQPRAEGSVSAQKPVRDSTREARPQGQANVPDSAAPRAARPVPEASKPAQKPSAPAQPAAPKAKDAGQAAPAPAVAPVAPAPRPLAHVAAPKPAEIGSKALMSLRAVVKEHLRTHRFENDVVAKLPVLLEQALLQTRGTYAAEQDLVVLHRAGDILVTATTENSLALVEAPGDSVLSRSVLEHLLDVGVQPEYIGIIRDLAFFFTKEMTDLEIVSSTSVNFLSRVGNDGFPTDLFGELVSHAEEAFPDDRATAQKQAFAYLVLLWGEGASAMDVREQAGIVDAPNALDIPQAPVFESANTPASTLASAAGYLKAQELDAVLVAPEPYREPEVTAADDLLGTDAPQPEQPPVASAPPAKVGSADDLFGSDDVESSPAPTAVITPVAASASNVADDLFDFSAPAAVPEAPTPFATSSEPIAADDSLFDIDK